MYETKLQCFVGKCRSSGSVNNVSVELDHHPPGISMGPVINYGEGGGGVQNGKIAGPKLLRPPSRQSKTCYAPPL